MPKSLTKLAQVTWTYFLSSVLVELTGMAQMYLYLLASDFLGICLYTYISLSKESNGHIGHITDTYMYTYVIMCC